MPHNHHPSDIPRKINQTKLENADESAKKFSIRTALKKLIKITILASAMTFECIEQNSHLITTFFLLSRSSHNAHSKCIHCRAQKKHFHVCRKYAQQIC